EIGIWGLGERTMIWTGARVAPPVHKFDHFQIGECLVLASLQDSVPDPRHEFNEGGITREVASAEHRINETTNHIDGFNLISIGNWGADQDVRLTRVEVEQQVESSQLHHELGRMMCVSQHGERLLQISGHASSYPLC